MPTLLGSGPKGQGNKPQRSEFSEFSELSEKRDHSLGASKAMTAERDARKMERETAAVRIQAAFRGWVVRCPVVGREAEAQFLELETIKEQWTMEQQQTEVPKDEAILSELSGPTGSSMSGMSSTLTAKLDVYLSEDSRLSDVWHNDSEERRRAKALRRKRKAERLLAEAQLQPFLLRHGFADAKSRRQRLLWSCYPLHIAVREKDPEAVRLLLKAGADRNTVDSAGRTPQHLAVNLNRNGSHTAVLCAFGPALPEYRNMVPIPEPANCRDEFLLSPP
jgi:hypothetical protein